LRGGPIGYLKSINRSSLDSGICLTPDPFRSHSGRKLKAVLCPDHRPGLSQNITLGAAFGIAYIINLSPDKKKVFQEAFRVLKPGGEIVVSDIVAEGIPENFKPLLWASCVGGAVDETSYLKMIRDAGFDEVQIVGRLDYDREMIKGLLGSGCLELPTEVRRVVEEHGSEWNARISSIKVSARKKTVS
jgi:SAM-dependent methyltransferase